MTAGKAKAAYDTAPPAWSNRTARENRRFNEAMDRISIGVGTFAFTIFAAHIIMAAFR